MDATLEEQILEKLNQVPAAKLPAVVDFLEFLTWQAHQSQAARPKAVSTAELLQALRGRGEGERLVERLLQYREMDRTLDEQSTTGHIRS